MKTIHIFLASSINEFAGLRDRLSDFIEGQTRAGGTRFVVERCEDMDRAFSREPKQEELNRAAADCDFFFLLVGRDAGSATVEEFHAAYQAFRASGPAKRPRIRVFFQNLPDAQIQDGRKRFREQIYRDLRQYPDEFTDPAEVERDILHEFGQQLGFGSAERLAERAQGQDAARTLSAHMAENRRRAAALSKDGVTAENRLELAALYAENAHLAEREDLDRGALYDYAAFLYKDGEHKRAVSVAGKLDRYYNSADDPDDRAGVKLLLGKCHFARGSFENAEPYFRDAETLFREEEDGLSAAEAAEGRAACFAETHRPRGAEAAYRAALSGYLDALEEEPDECAYHIRNICHGLRLLCGAGRGEEAGILHRGEDGCAEYAVNGDEARLNAEAESLRAWLERYPMPPDPAEEAYRLCERAAAEQTKDNPGEYEFALADFCGQVADMLREHNKMEGAFTLAQKAVELARKLPGENARTRGLLAACLNALALAAQNTNQPETAERLYWESSDIWSVLAKEDPAYEPEAVRPIENLATLLWETKRYGEAEPLYREDLKTRRRLAEKNPAQYEPDVAQTCNNLAILLRKMVRYGEAELLYREALQICRKRDKEDPAAFEPYVARTCNNLANLLEDMARYGEAEAHYLEALQIFHRYAKEDPAKYEPGVARTCYNLGLFELNRRHNRRAAKAYFDEAIAIYEKYPHFEYWLNQARKGRSLCVRRGGGVLREGD